MMRPCYAVVTGAWRGLGRAFARALAERRRNLVLVARSKERLDALAKELKDSYATEVVSLEFDLASPLAGQRLAQQLLDRKLRIDLLVNNAGFGARGQFADLPIKRQLEMIRLNSQVVVELTFHLLPMIREHRGSIINIASTAGFQPIPYAIVYAATKAFLINFSQGLEYELRPHGVKVVTVCPGRIRNESSAEASRNRWGVFSGVLQSPEAVVRDALGALDCGRTLVVPGAANKVSIFVQRLIPRRVIPKIVARLSRV